MHHIDWSPAEKKIARQAFDHALQRELAATLAQLQQRAVKASNAGDVWDIHDYLGKQRKQIDQKYDYRYSQLIWVFGRLLHEQWLEENQLAGLAPDKLQAIRDFASVCGR